MPRKPTEEQIHFYPHIFSLERNSNASQPLGFKAPKEPFDYRGRTSLFRCAITWRDTFSSRPPAKSGTVELPAPIGNNIIRSHFALTYRSSEEGTNLLGIWLLREYYRAHHTAREMIDYHAEPPCEGPESRERERKPRRPESRRRRDHGEVDEPDMIGVL